MLALLPILVLGACILASRARLACWPEAILSGAVVWGVVMAATTELLSVFHELTPAGLTSVWLIALLVGAVVVFRRRETRLAWPLRHLERVDVVFFAPLGILVAALAAPAILAAPNTWDAMTYHMARLIHWQQHATLAPYPTNIPRQLYLQPGAEFVLLHLQLLSGGDHLAGLVQWASMLGVLVGTWLIAKDLGAERFGGFLTIAFAASLPIVVLESTSTQNDYVVAFWLVCAVFFALRIMRWRGPALPWQLAVAFGASLGLALLTKATAYFIILPLLTWVAVARLRRPGIRSFGWLMLAGALALALNLGFYARNVLVFGTPLGPTDEGTPSLHYINADVTPTLVASNLVRDVGLNFIATPVVGVNVRGVNIVAAIHAWLGVDIADSRTTWGEELFREQPVEHAFDENFASNPIHVVLLAAALVATWALRRSPAAFAVVLGTGFLLFAAVLRWQPWHTRLELPFLVLGAPVVGVTFERMAPRLTLAVATALVLSMLPWVVDNQARPLLGPRTILAVNRDEEYLTNRPDLRAAYLAVVAFLRERNCASIGFISDVDGAEYPLWALLENAGLDRPVLIEHVGVANASAAQARAAEGRFQPCAVVSFQATPTETMELGGETFRRRAWAIGQAAILTVDGR